MIRTVILQRPRGLASRWRIKRLNLREMLLLRSFIVPRKTPVQTYFASHSLSAFPYLLLNLNMFTARFCSISRERAQRGHSWISHFHRILSKRVFKGVCGLQR
ncbi:unnamed protein product [Amoebophrya sp. A120]|nr:unnamed protein product [Amoebophrya sp. A120]CAD7935979.1 unnamed protein product [Amoebophrya sp. A120]|eukprot:GSA120T00021303001.1